MEIIQYPGDFNFSGNIKDVVIVSDLTVTLKLNVDDATLVNEQYTASGNQVKISLRNLFDQILSIEIPDSDIFVQRNAVKEISAEVSEPFYHTSFRFNVIKGGLDNNTEDLFLFLRSNWLTFQPQIKFVTRHQPEYLSYFATAGSGSNVKVKAYFADNTTETKDITNIALYTFVTLNVSFAHINSLFEKQVGYYDVWVENVFDGRLSYIQRYILTPSAGNEQVYVFENTLGGFDTVVFTGQLIEGINTSGIIATKDETSLDSDIDFSIIYEQNSGFVPTIDHAHWLREFFLSKQRYHVTDSFKRIYIEESENKFELKALNSFSFEFRYAKQSRYSNIIRNQEALPELLEFPQLDNLFFLAPRLAEFPAATIANDLLLPVQFAFEEMWRKISIAAILQYVIGQSVETIHGQINLADYWEKTELVRDELYLKFLDQKINAGYSDKANEANNAEKWENHSFADYLNQAVRTNSPVTFASVITALLHTPNFAAGPLGAGVGVINENEVQTDNLLVRKIMFVLEMAIQKIRHQGGILILSPASMKISKVTDGGSYWKCFFESDNGNIPNEFIENDQARLQNFTGSSTKYLWSRVTSVGPDYINLSKTDKDGAGIPEPGDDLVQLGHRSDANRQDAVLISSVNGEVGIVTYFGINSFSLDGKEGSWIGKHGGKKGAHIRGSFQLETGEDIGSKLGEQTVQLAAIGGRLDNTEGQLSAQTGQITSLQTTVSAIPGQITQTVTTILDYMRIGTRNYLLKSRLDNLDNWHGMGGIVSVVNDSKFGTVVEYSRPEGGGEFEKYFELSDRSALANSDLVFIVICKPIDQGGHWYFGGWPQTFNILSSVGHKIDLGDGWFMCHCTFKSEESIGDGAFGINTISGTWRFYAAGVFKGNKAVDWSPAPEDTVSELQVTKIELQSGIDVLSGQLSLYTRRSDFDALNNRVGQTESSISLIPGQITQTVTSAINNVQFGGRNLLLNSACPTNYNHQSGLTVSIENEELKVIAQPGNGGPVALFFADNILNTEILKDGDDVVISCYARSPNSNNIPLFYLNGTMSYQALTGVMSSQYSQISLITKYRAGGFSPHFSFAYCAGEFYFKWFKIEKGNKPTDWSKALEDIASEADIKTLGRSWSAGKMLYTDPTFKTSFNGLRAYNNLGNSDLTLNWIPKLSDSPVTDSGFNVEIINTGPVLPGLGGFCFATPTRANAILICRFVAKIPAGYILNFGTNPTGDNPLYTWATEYQGTGKWEEYIYVVKCGATGGFDTTMYFYLTGTAGTPANPVIWYLAYASVFDLSAGENALTQVIEAKSQIIQLADEISLKVSRGDIFTGLKLRPELIEITGATIFRNLTGDQISFFGAGNDIFTINGGIFKVDKNGKLVAKDVEIEGIINAKGGVFAGYLQLPFKTIDQSDATYLGYDNTLTGYLYKLQNDLNIDASGQGYIIVLPNDVAYDGKVVNIFNNMIMPITSISKLFWTGVKTENSYYIATCPAASAGGAEYDPPTFFKWYGGVHQFACTATKYPDGTLTGTVIWSCLTYRK